MDRARALRSLPQDYATVEVEQVTPTGILHGPEADAIQVQAAVEGVDLPQDEQGKLDPRITFLGSKFRIADKVGLMPLIKFAAKANSGMDTANMEALSAIYEMLRDCIHENDWEKFQQHAIDTKADADELLPVVNQTIELLSARPTKQGSVSSESSPTISGTSTESFSDPRAEGLVSADQLGRVVS